jgi:hypothetical protein
MAAFTPLPVRESVTLPWARISSGLCAITDVKLPTTPSMNIVVVFIITALSIPKSRIPKSHALRIPKF